MKDPKMKLPPEITAQMARDRYDALLQRWVTFLKDSEDHEVKKDHALIQANLADRSRREFFKCDKMEHITRKEKSPAMCAVC